MFQYKKLFALILCLSFSHCEKEEFFQILGKNKESIQTMKPFEMEEKESVQITLDRKALYRHLFYNSTFSDIQIEFINSDNISGYIIKGISPDHIFRKIFQSEPGDVFLSIGGYPLKDKSGLSSGFRTLFSNLEFVHVGIQRKDGKKEVYQISFKKEEKKNQTLGLWEKELKVILTPTEYSSFRAELSGYEFKNESGQNGFIVPEIKNGDISAMIGLLPGDIIYILDDAKLDEPHSLHGFYKKEVIQKLGFSILRANKELFFQISTFSFGKPIEKEELKTDSEEKNENIFQEKMENENE